MRRISDGYAASARSYVGTALENIESVDDRIEFLAKLRQMPEMILAVGVIAAIQILGAGSTAANQARDALLEVTGIDPHAIESADRLVLERQAQAGAAWLKTAASLQESRDNAKKVDSPDG